MNIIEYTMEEGVIVLIPDGSITSRSYPEIEKKIADNVPRGFKKVVADMGRVEFIDSAGLVFLLRLKKLIESAGGFLEILNPSYFIKKTLKTMHLDRFFNISLGSDGVSVEFCDNGAGVQIPVHLN